MKIRITRGMRILAMGMVAALVVAGTALGEVSRTGLVAEYHFEGDVKDSSGNGNDGKIYEATFVDGMFGKALSLDGVDDFVIVPDSSSMNIISGNMTIEAWVKLAGPTTEQYDIADKMGLSGYLLHTLSGGYPRFCRQISGFILCFDGNQNIVDNQWHHIVVVQTGKKTVSIYVDNILQGRLSSTLPLEPKSPGHLRIGQRNDGTDTVNGLIDEVRIYNRALSAEEVKEIYGSIIGISPSTTVTKSVYSPGALPATPAPTTTLQTSIPAPANIPASESINSNIYAGIGAFAILLAIVALMRRGKFFKEKSIKDETMVKPIATPPFPETGVTGKSIEYPEIRRGYVMLPNNDIKFGIRIINNSKFTVTDVDTILDYPKPFPKPLFFMKDSEIQHHGNIMPNSARTTTFILKPLGCIHNEQINALITYKDHTGKKQTLHMHPKEVHCVCPFLKEKPLSEGEYSRLAESSEFVQEGISFNVISVEDLANFMGETCRHTLYKVREYEIEGKKVMYLSGESIGEKAYYLLTAVIQEYKGLTQVVLRAHSDKKYGLNGFMNEIADSIRHLVGSVQNAKEVGIIENTQVINIIDSVVQRTSFNMEEGINIKDINIKNSIIQRSIIGAGARKCSECGKEVEANEKFCNECGARL